MENQQIQERNAWLGNILASVPEQKTRHVSWVYGVIDPGTGEQTPGIVKDQVEVGEVTLIQVDIGYRTVSVIHCNDGGQFTPRDWNHHVEDVQSIPDVEWVFQDGRVAVTVNGLPAAL